jgi:hypothetical protein
MNNTPVKKHIIVLITTVILCGICFAGLSYFANLMYVKKNKVLTIKEQLASYDQNKKIFSEESSALAAIGTRVSALESYFITSASTPQLLSGLEELGQKNNIDFTITSVQTPGAGAANQKLLIDFSAKGSAAQLDAFFTALSHQSYQIVFTKFSLFADGVSQNSQALAAPTSKIAPKGVPQWAALASIEVISF